MLTAPLRRKSVPLLLSAALALPWAVPAGQASFSSRLWNSLQDLWAKAGCHLDPDGRCVKGRPAQPEAGCDIDPWGQCVTPPAPQPKAGCNIDPWGRCLP